MLCLKFFSEILLANSMYVLYCPSLMIYRIKPGTLVTYVMLFVANNFGAYSCILIDFLGHLFVLNTSLFFKVYSNLFRNLLCSK